MRLLWAALLALIACGNAAAEPVTFRPVDVYVDAGVRIDTDVGVFEVTIANALGRLR